MNRKNIFLSTQFERWTMSKCADMRWTMRKYTDDADVSDFDECYEEK